MKRFHAQRLEPAEGLIHLFQRAKAAGLMRRDRAGELL
jgi:hypothetical protein